MPLLFALLLCGLLCLQTGWAKDLVLPVVPIPADFNIISDNQWQGDLRFVVRGQYFLPQQQQLTKFLRSQQLLVTHVKATDFVQDVRVIIFNLKPELKPEQYQLTIDQHINIYANNNQGAFYALQSLKQMLIQQFFAQLTIHDWPQLQWRGSMIDVARHFRSLDYLKKHIQRMALFKMNKLHLHLSDDQGFRLQIKAFSQLTAQSKRYSVYKDAGGVYSQQQMRELIEFAQQHFVEIIPEIDLPSHTRAITHAYPELACEGDDTAFYTGTRVLKTKLCLQKMSQIIDFSQRMLAEVMALFPSRYLHIGGDEVSLSHPSEARLLAKFYATLFDLAHQHNKKIIGWEELMAANATPERAIYQLWNLPSDYLTQAQQHQYPVVLSFCDFFYFDHGYYSDQPYMATWCDRGGVSMQKMQQFSMQPFASLNVIGVEAALWGELVRTEQRADRRLWPRLVAVAQIAWQPQLVTNMPSVQQTIGHLMHWLKIDFYQKEDFFHTIRK